MINILIIGIGTLGSAVSSKLKKLKDVNVIEYDKKTGYALTEDILKDVNLAINCSESDYSHIEKYCPVFNTDNKTTKNSVIIQNVNGYVKSGDTITIYRPYDVNRRSFGQENNFFDFFWNKMHHKHNKKYRKQQSDLSYK